LPVTNFSEPGLINHRLQPGS